MARMGGVEGRIDFLRGRSDLTRVAERGDVLISELVGNRILNEGLLEATLDARRRFLRPDARYIPRRLEIFAVVGTARRYLALEEELSHLGRQYGVSLDPLREWFRARLETGQVVWELGEEEGAFDPLSEEVPVASFDLADFQSPRINARVEIDPVQRGSANAVLLAFRLELLPGVDLSTQGPRHDLHWNKPVYMLRAPVPLEPGVPATLEARYEPQGEIALSLEARSGT
jgi:hypothetical protein